MTASEVLQKFRALGGVADNVAIRPSRHGHGLFAVNSGQPVRLVAPAELLISPRLLLTTPEGHIKIKPASGVSAEVAAFHEHYQRTFGWGAGGLADVRQHRQQLCALPDSVKTFLQIFGCRDDLNRQLTPADAFERHCISRQISVNGVSKLMPVLELINHADEGAPYLVAQDGVTLSGTFDGEVTARYRRHLDAFHFFFNYHFANPGRSTLSCDVRIAIPGRRSLRISRMDGLSEERRDVRWPQVSSSKDEVHLSFVELVNLDQPSAPRQVFLELLKDQGIPTSSLHQLFEGLIAHNRQVLVDFLKACEGLEGAAIEDLKKVTTGQLNNLAQARSH